MPERPTRLGAVFLSIIAFGLAVSFVSGVLLWIAQIQREQSLEPPSWQHLCRTTHGLLNPLLCLLFGYLWRSHIPGGWRMKANRKTGALILADVAVLIISGQGLYYSNAREFWFWSHLAFGLLLPLALALHWLFARRWVASLSEVGTHAR
jgi:hypothetical protein